MSRYLLLSKYSAAGAAGARADGYTTREAEGGKLVKALGGSVESWMWLDWADWDFALVVVLPDREALLRLAALSSASGAFARTYASEIVDGATMDRAGANAGDWRPPGQAH